MLSSLLNLSRRLPSQIRLLSTTSFQDWKTQYFTAGSSPQLEAWLVSNIGTFVDDEVGEVLRSFKRHANKPIDPALAIALQSEIEARVSGNLQRNWKLLYNAAKIHGKMKKAGVDMVPLVSEITKNHFTLKTFEATSLPYTALLLSTFSKLHSQSHGIKPIFTLKTGENVFDAAKATLPKRFEAYKQDESGYWLMILNSAINQHWGSEEFIRSLEKQLLPELPNIPVPSFIDLPTAYASRQCDDYYYLQECYQRPYHRELERKAEIIGPGFVSQAFTNLAAPLTHPFYCDEQFAAFMCRALRNRLWLKDRENTLEITSSLLQLAARIGLTSPHELIKQIRYNLVSCSSRITMTKLPFLARYYSMLPIEDENFWNMFYRNLPTLLRNPNWTTSIYSTLLNLKVYNEKVHKQCMDLPVVQEKLESLRKDRATQHLQHTQEWLEQPPCKAVEGYLTRTGQEFVKGHFDDFYIDFAFVGKKVAVDVCAEQHFVLPALTLAGHKKVKKAILESKGWRYETLPLLNRPTDAAVEAKAKEFFESKITVT